MNRTFQTILLPTAQVAILILAVVFVTRAYASQPIPARRAASDSPLASASILSQRAYLPLLAHESPRVYWGALVAGLPPTTAALAPGAAFDSFETRAGKKMAILHWGQPWQMNGSAQPFQRAYFDNVRQRGSIPLLDWGSWDAPAAPDQAQFQLNKITNGLYDSYIQQWARDAKAWGHPFFLRFDWEMNGNWQFPWSEQLNQNQPGDYVKAWRHVHDIFTANGATNVTWVWCPNIASPITEPYAALYPGDAYVDWTCLDGYNNYPAWISFKTVFSGSGIQWIYNSYQGLLTIAPTKPIMIGETASLEAGDGGASKAAWITDALTMQLPLNLPKVKAIVWFNWDCSNPLYSTLPIESSPASVTAFRSAISSSTFAANEFASLDISPIPPP